MLTRGEPGQKVYGNFCTTHIPSVSALWMPAFSICGSASKDTGDWLLCIILYIWAFTKFGVCWGVLEPTFLICWGNCILRFSVSLKLFPNKQFILSALPHVRESSAPWISADGEDGPPPALRGCPPLTLSLWNLGRPLPRLLSAGRSSANDAGNAVGVQETFVEAWR